MKIIPVVLLAALILSTPSFWADEGQPSILFNDSYGERLPGSTKEVILWSASSAWKVAKTRPVPSKTAKVLEVSLAQNEREAVQFVVSPGAELRGLAVSCDPLTGPEGAILAVENVEVLRVRYVDVKQQTDAWGAVAPWPDPLPPIKAPLTLGAKENHPFWVRVFAPKGTPAGEYRGTIRLNADAYSAEVPLRVNVYEFELPDRMTCETAFGFDPGAVYRYQKIADPEQRKQVLEKYWASLAAHHISPYHPTPNVEPTVNWVKLGPNEGAELSPEDRTLCQANALTPIIDWTAWDAEIERVFDKYQFRNFRLGIPGIGGGDFQGFKDGTRERELAFDNYCRTVQEHLREKGLLDAAYVYWTDEPTKNDYPAVMAGFNRLKKAAPDIRRMLTEEVQPELVGGPNLWCPMTMTYNHERAEERRKAGEHFWWYVCTIPKRPFCGLFIDHPGVDFRMWLWQTWYYGVEGILIWQSNLWTTGCAYPDKPQNPYEDPMSWMHGYGTKPGEKRPWGNGDGRFMYPPEAAADANPPQPVLDGPVDSMRWEMLRDGIEDYEYFVILKRLIGEQRNMLSKGQLKKVEALLTVPESIFVNLKDYTKDPAPLEKRREQIARAIERLSK